MALHTSLLHFNVPPDLLINDASSVEEGIVELFGGNGFKRQNVDLTEKSSNVVLFIQFTKSDGSFCSVHGFKNGLFTVDLHEYVPHDKQCHFTYQVMEKIESKLKTILHTKDSKLLPAVRRGATVDCYFSTTDNLFVEYDFHTCLVNEDSPYQNVKIMSSNQFGNVLILDNDINLAESDLPYTQAITGNGTEDYKDKTVLILGGGDGGILHELLKQQPKFITMIDIDQVVIDGARKYLRGICHDSLDKLSGPNYQVIVEDCIPYLKKYSEEGRIFDFVINDLTAIPVTTEPVGDQWDFLRMILDYSMQVLAPTGRYYTQGNGVNARQALQMYEEQLKRLSVPVEFSKETVCVPSYHELWVFYKIWKTQT